jgi:hypothetical protein
MVRMVLNVNLQFTVTDTQGRSGTISNGSISGTGSQYFHFDQISNSNVNLTKAAYLQLTTVNPPRSLDFEFAFVESVDDPNYTPVPFEFTPSLGLILGGGLFGFLRLQSKLKASKIKN